MTRVALRELIEQFNSKNIADENLDLFGININKQFITSVANTIGTDMSNYKILNKGTFAFNPMHIGRDKVLPIALYNLENKALISPAYITFKVKKNAPVLDDYLNYHFMNPNFDHFLWFKSDSSVRGGISWDDLCEYEIDLPDIDEQKKIVNRFNVIKKDIDVLSSINKKILNITTDIYNKYSSNEVEIKTIENCDFIKILSSGISKFDGNKIYLDTSCVDGCNIVDTSYLISYNERPSRANMQPIENSLWFAKMGGSFKNILVTPDKKELLDNYIFSTGFSGLQVEEDYLYYVWSWINTESFNKGKYLTANGTMMASINNTDINNMKIKVPTIENLKKFNYLVKQLWDKEMTNSKIIDVLNKLFNDMILSL